MRPRISIRGFVRPSVGPSVCWSVGPSVHQAFLKYCGNVELKTRKHQGTHRIGFLVEIQENSAKFKKIQQNLLDALLFELNLFSVGGETGMEIFYPFIRSSPLRLTLWPDLRVRQPNLRVSQGVDRIFPDSAELCVPLRPLPCFFLRKKSKKARPLVNTVQLRRKNLF